MLYKVLFIYLILSLSHLLIVYGSFEGFIFNAPSQEEIHSICQHGIFNASCLDNEVIIITYAEYGRMRTGTCVPTSFGHIGCSQNVLPYMQSTCSGRQRCEIDIPGKALKGVRPCPTGLENYLAVKYDCQKVHTSTEESCDHSLGHPRSLNITIPIQSAQKPGVTLDPVVGYLSSLITAHTGHGSSNCPWIITVPLGQRINITLLDFSSPAHLQKNDVIAGRERHTYCHKYAVIHERLTVARRAVICGGDGRHKNVFLSSGNVVEISLMRYLTPKKFAYFLLKYETQGCARLDPPVGGWLEQAGSEVIVGCNNTKDASWSLRCNGNTWVGETRNCSAYDSGYDNVVWNNENEDWSSPLGILIVTALGVALGLIIGVILLASVLFCLKRQPRWCGSTHSNYSSSVVVTSGDGDEGGRRELVTYCKRHPASAASIAADSVELVHLNGDQTYGTMWKARPPPPSYTTGCTATSPCNLSRIIGGDSGHLVASMTGEEAPMLQSSSPVIGAATSLPSEVRVIRVGVPGSGATCPSPCSMGGSTEALRGVDVVKHATAALSSFRPKDSINTPFVSSSDTCRSTCTATSGVIAPHEYDRPAFMSLTDGTATLHCRPITTATVGNGTTKYKSVT